MNAKDIRDKYLNFFKSRGHVEIPSASLVPENDPTTLFSSSGMQPMIPYLLGQSHPLGTRIVDSQKCFRAQDIDEVGDSRHTTFFEMLGNWSLGDYFKKEQLEYIFTFLVDKEVGLGLDPRRLYVSVFAGEETQSINGQPISQDNETVKLWQELFSRFQIDAELDQRIFPYPSKKNWWSRSGPPDSMPVGEPGGPDSEVFFDFGEEHELHQKSIWSKDKCHVNCDCGRFMEIGNSVFMQYQKIADKQFKDLPAKNIDFGGGLSRMEAAYRNDPDMFNISTLKPLVNWVESLSGSTYSNEVSKVSLRIIADHLTAATFLIKDGVLPSNKAQGYLLRRLIRRSVLKYSTLTEKEDWSELSGIIEVVVKIYGNLYFNVEKDIIDISKIIGEEIVKFSKTLKKGLTQINRLINRNKTISGQEAFDLYQSYGFPIELIQEEFQKNKLNFNLDEFNKFKEDHQKLSQTLSAGKFKSGLADHSEIITKYHTATHLLHASLRKILGDHVQQSGSNITGERLRFDFSHSEKLTSEQIESVSKMVQTQIDAKLQVTKDTMSYVDAVKSGALAFFGTKYPEIVSVYSMGSFSKEVCTGPHVENTGTLGKFKITREESAGSGKRRIYAVLE